LYNTGKIWLQFHVAMYLE